MESYPDLVTSHQVVIEHVQQIGSSGVCADLHKLNSKHVVPYVMTLKAMRRVNDHSLEIRLVGYTGSGEP